ncbi:3-dehydroquinate synthase [Propionimicrobium sp. PCR01-08-3]|uniref:3-dehydroquinate synthase n=1 Tax=Propionimicrobium sp. PCR01-08-3 TaxID=3052086 RepID=UPI00255C5B51|nr:3-dehydroquinate synthase [Propionimicrobium sp. PCR01-08-3]WIY83894.1 3-dehydroquinate synthase [Propionimicrobium sp. PCR01-08-3]
MSTVRFATDHPYDVEIEVGALQKLPGLVTGATRVAVIYAEPVSEVALEVSRLVGSASVSVLSVGVPAGEAAKTPQILASCWSALANAGFTRSDLIIGVGGGATTDLAGFVAASWLRGVRYLSVPTTVLAMVDAAVGGKTGIDLPEGKNLVGAFHEPGGVIADLDLLRTLPDREVRSGLAEVIKAGFVRDERIRELVAVSPAGALDVTSARHAELIRRAVQFKADVVATDLRESTSVGSAIGRELLNYGHTMGHAIEAWENYRLRHGEAVALGMIYAAQLSRRLLGLSDEAVSHHRELIGSLGLATSYRRAPFAELRELMGRDKKTRGAALRFVGLRNLGDPAIIAAPSERVLEECYAELAHE